jgi:hypothetical protein
MSWYLIYDILQNDEDIQYEGIRLNDIPQLKYDDFITISNYINSIISNNTILKSLKDIITQDNIKLYSQVQVW